MEMELMKVKEEMKNAKLEHENKELRAELAHQKLLNAHMTKMEKCQKKQQQTIDELTEKLTVSIDLLSFKHKEHEEQRKLDALKQQKETEDKIDSLNDDQKEQCGRIF